MLLHPRVHPHIYGCENTHRSLLRERFFEVSVMDKPPCKLWLGCNRDLYMHVAV